MAEQEFYRVEVSDGKGQIVAIEPRMLAGRDICENELATIQIAIDHLCAFSGLSPSVGESPKADAVRLSPDAENKSIPFSAPADTKEQG